MTNPHEMIELFRLLADPGYPFELRALCGGRDFAGWYDCDHIPQAVSTALSLNEKRDRDGTGYQFSGIYFTLNPVKPELLSRRSNRVALAQRGFPLTADSDIAYRRWLLIDIDPVRAAGISATDDEKRQAMATGKPVLSYLKECGWPDPLIADSGNGFHLLYRINLPNDDPSRLIVRDCLRALASMFDTDSAKVDTSVFNAARICKSYGTVSRKGDSTADRPWRRARAAIIPASVEIVSVDKLKQLAELAPKDERKQPQSGVKSGRRGGSLFPVDEQARKYLSAIDPAIEGQGGSGVTFRVACALVQGFDMTPDDALPLFREYNERCVPPWSEDDLMHKLQDADKRTGDRGYLLSQKRESARPMHENEFELMHFGELPAREVSIDDLPSALDSIALPGEEADPLAGIGLDGIEPEDTGDVDPSRWGVSQAESLPSLPTAADESKTEAPEPVRNFVEKPRAGANGTDVVKVPLPMKVIADRVYTATAGWPKRVGECLFVRRFKNDGVQWLQSSDELFAYIGEATGFPPQFIRAGDDRHVHSKGELFSYLKRVSHEFQAVENLPHEPLMKGHYYACDIPAPGSGSRLQELVGMFSPETEIDRDLILAMFVTPFWGGDGGTRPAFCITSEAGRGCGKSTLAACVSDLAGGCIEIGANEDIQGIKTRFLSSEGLKRRVALLDNVKSYKFSSAELEALITSRAISGKRLYEGEATRPNTFTFIVTLNGVSLSKDLAQRCVIVKLAKPDFSGTWAEDVQRFIEIHRGELIADILAFLRSDQAQIAGFNRWGAWQQAVLSRLPEPTEAAKVIKEREGVADADTEESVLIEEHFARRLEDLGYKPDEEKVFIPSQIAFEWYVQATGERSLTITKAMTVIRQKVQESQFRNLFKATNTNVRGIEWIGKDSTGTTVRRDLTHQIEISKRLA